MLAVTGATVGLVVAADHQAAQMAQVVLEIPQALHLLRGAMVVLEAVQTVFGQLLAAVGAHRL